jgi:CheY-like chemotaxis protein
MHILLVEHHRDSAVMYERLLARDGHLVTRAESLAEARHAFNNRSFDLLICDVNLPDGDGNSLMRDVSAPRGVPGIALMGNAFPGDLQQTRTAGFAAHLVKPVDLKDLMQTIETVASKTP